MINVKQLNYKTLDGKTLSLKQAKVLWYNGYTEKKISEKTYKEVSEIIGKCLRDYEFEKEFENEIVSIDGMEEWECPIDPWGD